MSFIYVLQYVDFYHIIAGFCEHGNESSGSLKGREFLD
jgi:hypothetical protein